MMYYIEFYPDIKQKLRKEIVNVITSSKEGEPITPENLNISCD